MRKLLLMTMVLAVLVGAGWIGLRLLTPAQTGGVSASQQSCPKVPSATVGQITVPSGPIAGFCQAELVNAAHVMNAARALGIGTHTQAVGVMTAIGESGLRNLSYGDAAGPDSRGLFQQRDNGAWGTTTDRMNPYTAATNFFNKLTSLDGWQTMSPTEAAHAVQVNADPSYYAAFWPEAQRIVAALTP